MLERLKGLFGGGQSTEDRASVRNSTGGNYDLSFGDLTDALFVGRPSASQIAAVEIATGYVARAFMGADIEAPGVDPLTLGMMARGLMLGGNSVWLIEIFDGEVYLVPAQEWEISGDHNPASWRYSNGAGQAIGRTNEEERCRRWGYSHPQHAQTLRPSGKAFLLWRECL